MEKNNFKKDNIYVSEEEKTLNWVEIQSAFKRLLVLKYIIAGYKRFL